MTSRLLAAAAAVAAFTLPAAAQAPAQGPALTFQAKSLGQLLDDAKAVVRAVGGDQAVQELERNIRDGLGEKGFAGVDLQKPIVGYAELTETAEATGGVAVVPVTDEKDFLDLLRRMKLTVEEVKDQPGVYKLTPKDPPAGEKKADVPTRLRFKDRSAYLGFNLPDDRFAPDKLIPASALVQPNETAEFAYRVHIQRIPAGLRKQGFEAIDKAVTQLQALPGNGVAGEAAKSASDALAKLIKRVGDQALRDGDIASVRVRLDPATAEVALEAALSGKPGSQLAKDIAERKPTTNRFAGLVTKDTAAGFTLQLPFFAPEVRDAATAGLELGQKVADQEAPPLGRPILAEVLKGLVRTVKGGEFDLAGAVAGPDKDGTFTAVLAFSFDDPSGVEKAVKDLIKTTPEELQKQVKFDAEKVNGVSVHRIDIGPFTPPEVRPVIGEKAVLALAFAPKGVYLAVGPAGMEAVAAALKAGPAPARALDVLVNPNRLQKLVAAANPQSGEQVAKVLGTDDKTMSALSVSIEGGAELRVRIGLNLKLLPRAGAATAVGGAAAGK